MPSFLYTLIGVAISLPISIALLAWMLHYKKDRKFLRESGLDIYYPQC